VVIEADSFTKRFGGVGRRERDVSVRAGEIYASSARTVPKSTLMRILAGVSRPTRHRQDRQHPIEGGTRQLSTPGSRWSTRASLVPEYGPNIMPAVPNQVRVSSAPRSSAVAGEAMQESRLHRLNEPVSLLRCTAPVQSRSPRRRAQAAGAILDVRRPR